jgi:probable DNA metabolism protein
VTVRRISLPAEDDFEAWRDAARACAAASLFPDQVVWQVGSACTDLFAEQPLPASPSAPAFNVPQNFMDLARSVVCHRDPERFALLYTLLLRLRRNPRALEDKADIILRRVEAMARTVRRDVHKMRAFLRMREVYEVTGPRFIAWHEPEHHIVRYNAGFFVRRFSTMRWSILTPDLSIHWDTETLTEGPGARRADAPQGDPVEETWHTYYSAIFNPARVKIGAMTKEMPRKYWRNMPETALIPDLIASAQERERTMIATSTQKLIDL